MVIELSSLNPQPLNPPMKLSAKTEYACLAMLQLAAEYSKRRAGADSADCRRARHPVAVSGADSAAAQRRVAGGEHARCGGRLSARAAAAEITLAEVIEVMEGDERPATNAGKNTPLVGSLLHLCRELDEMQRDRLMDTTLTDLVEQAGEREPMWYI